MIDLTNVKHHHAVEEIAEILSDKTQNKDIKFLRVMTAYFIAKMASNMRTKLLTKDRGTIPVNIYTISLAVSGAGKGHAVWILEEEITKGFTDRFTGETFPKLADAALARLSLKRGQMNGTGADEELESLRAEFNAAGALAYTFDGGTTAAIKQLRHKLLMAEVGAINLQVDEFANNITGSKEVLDPFLELYDQGLIKQKLTKNTNDNKRVTEISGRTPANMLLFGTPNKLLDGAKIEEEFNSMLDTGYARRCFFAFGQRMRAAETETPAEIYAKLISQTNSAGVTKWHDHFQKLANALCYNWAVTVPDDVAIELLTYRIQCEQIAD